MNVEERRPGLVVARVGAGIGLAVAALIVLQPFLIPVAWAAIAAYTTWPLFVWVSRRTGRPRIAAALLTAAVAFGLGVPLAWVLATVANEASHLVLLLQASASQPLTLPDWISSRSWLREPIEQLRATWLADSHAVRDLFTQNLSEISSRLLSLAGGLARNVLQLAVTLMALFVLYLDGERVLAQARRLAGIFFPAAPEDFVDDIGAVVRAVVFGLLGTALAQGAIAAIGFVIFGVPSPVLLGMLTALASFLPFGPTLVWMAAVVGLVLAGETGAAIGMTVWGALLVSTVDNVLRPLLISGPTQIPFLLVLFGVLGGLSTLGLLGLFVGPVVLSVAFALLAEFGKRPELNPPSGARSAPPPSPGNA
ncbi:MAG TPA: AI-2E family transporter [Myxococcota bacterium]|jgi:predicted PurR-regulated permease PerM